VTATFDVVLALPMPFVGAVMQVPLVVAGLNAFPLHVGPGPGTSCVWKLMRPTWRVKVRFTLGVTCTKVGLDV
jgi:hypothetical protein